MIVESHSVEETLRIGRLLGGLAARQPRSVCIALDGPLGAGKTHLTRGIALGAGVADLTLVCSPTFVLLNIYEAGENGRRVYHFDAYRVHTSQEFDELGFEDILRAPGIVVVEWAARIAELLPPDTLSIRLEHAENNHRTLEITGHAALSRQLANALNK
jgi:tRNA threonylcarbamoyladenosine biosynthesis protein TsaE